MGMVLFIFLLLMEIGLVILTFIKKREKVRWLKDRVWFRLAETSVLLLLLVLPGVYNKFRFTAAFGLLLIRLLIAGIAYLAGRKKAEGTKRAAGLIVSCVLSVILIGGALMPAFIFTGYHGLPTTGDYAVKEMDVILVDASRLDTFENDGSYREVPVHFYYPDMDSVDGDGREGTFPLILFSHGAFGYYQSNSSTYLELASHGYVVASLDHPHHAFFSKDTDGKVVIVDQGVIQGAVDVTNGVITGREAYDMTHEWLDLRVEDQNFVLDTIEEAKDRRVLTNREMVIRKGIQLLLIEAVVLGIAFRSPYIASEDPRVATGLALSVLIIYVLANGIQWLQGTMEAKRLTEDLKLLQERARE